MDIRQLSYFVEVAHQKSFSKAARQINISQPALSKCIQILEDELGTELFLRQPGNLILTEAGKIILADAKDLLMHFQAVTNKFGHIKNQIHPSVSIACTPLLGSMYGETLFKPLSQDYAQIKVTFFEDSSEQLINKVRLFELDLALCMLCGQDDKSLEHVSTEPMYDGNFIALARTDKGLEGSFLEDLDLSKEQLITTHELRSDPSKVLWAGVPSVFYSDHISLIRSKVLHEGAIAVVPDMACTLFPPVVRHFPLKNRIPFQISSVSNSGSAVSKAAILKAYFVSKFRASMYPI